MSASVSASASLPDADLRLRLELPGVATSAGVVRATIRTIAQAAGVEPELTADIVSAVSEACNNVVLHAYPHAGGPLLFTLTVSTDSVEAVVRDHGGGIRPGPSVHRGLGMGMTLIQSMAERAEYESSELGTAVRMRFRRAAHVSEPFTISIRRSGR